MSDAEGVQPDEGQGAQAQDTPWAQYLERIPEEARGPAEEAFREWDGQTTRKFQEAADFRRQMEPFAPLLTGRQAEEVEWALQFRDAATTNPQAIQDWFDGYAAEHNLTKAEQDQLEADLLADPDVTAQFQQQIAPLQQQIEAITQRFEQQDHATRVSEATAMINSQLEAEAERLGDRFNREAIEGLAGKYIETDPNNAIARAGQDWEQIHNQLEKGFLQEKVDTSQPAAESGGVPDGSPERITSLSRANEIAREQLRANRTA